MKLIVIPPYRDPNLDMGYVISKLVDKLKKSSGLEGDEIDVEEGCLLEKHSEVRDSAFLANITPGFLQKVREYSEMGTYDAIVGTGFLDPGFEAARTISKIPVVGAVHSSLHMASLIGKRTSIIVGTLPLAYAVRQVAESYGLGHKLASLRPYGHTTTALLKLISKHKDQLFMSPEAKGVTEAITTQCIKAIEKDRVDSLILGCEPTEIWEDDVRQQLDGAGYDEIPLICPTPACVQMARTMVSMGLKQTPRAYPTDTLRAQQEYA
ncbi:aspartate/glutamate racemase family protein [Thermodesulfobacteriota bacterium]